MGSKTRKKGHTVTLTLPRSGNTEYLESSDFGILEKMMENKRKRGRPRHTTPPKKLREILTYRLGFGFGSPNKVTLQETSEQFGVTTIHLSRRGKMENR